MINFNQELEKAKNGDGTAAYVVGVCYQNGYHGVVPNINLAFKWWKKGVKTQNNTLCVFMQCFLNRGNRKKAQKFFDQSFAKMEQMANEGNPYAQSFLGVYYSLGFMGNPIDYKKAADLYEKSATQGFVEAQHNIGCYYLEGKGVEYNIRTAIAWFDKAIAQGCSDSIEERQEAMESLRNSGGGAAHAPQPQPQQAQELKCSGCGGTIALQNNLKKGFCDFCGTGFLLG